MISKKHCYWVAPGLVVSIMLSVYAASRLFPFGTGTISWCDMNQQVIPFLMDFKDILLGKANMFLNLKNAGGMSFWGVFLFFIASPFSFLVLFTEKAQIYYLVNILLILKMAACSVTASLFFRAKFPRLNFLQVSALAVMYSFCGYTMFYYQNIVWLDVMCLFPILLLGLDRLFHQGRFLLYSLVFAAILAVNFYLCYMVVIFLILAAGVYLFLCVPKRERGRHVLLFGLATVASVLATGVVWLPSLLQVLSSARMGNVVSSLRAGGFWAKLDTTVPVLLCTAAVFAGMIMVLYLRNYWNQGIRWLLCMMVLLFLPIFVEPINKIWQTGSYQSFPVRYGYIPVFLGLILCAAVISFIKGSRTEYSGGKLFPGIALAALAAVMFCAGTILKLDYRDVTVYTRTLWGDERSFRLLLLFAVTGVLAYLILFLLYHYGKIREMFFSILLCSFAVVEAVFYSNVYIASAGNNAQYYFPILDLSDRIDDSSLYRVKMKQKFFDVNLIGSMGYNSLSHYTSLTSQNYMFAMKKLGYSSYWMEVNSNGGTKLTDAVLGNRYTIERTDRIPEGQNAVYGNGLYSIVKNNLSLSIGFPFRTDKIQTLKNLSGGTRLELQESLFHSLFDTDEDLFVPYEPSSYDNVTMTRGSRYCFTLSDTGYEGTVDYQIPVSGTQTLYFDSFDQLSNRLYEPINSSFSITVNGTMLQIDYPTQPDNGLINLGTFTNQTVSVQIGILRDVSVKSFGIAGLRDHVLSTAVAATPQASLQPSGNSISGTVTADSGGEYLFLPINYGSGYSASVNGMSTPIYLVFDTFMAIPLQKGVNRICLSYIPPGFQMGVILSAVGLLCLIILYRISKRRCAQHWKTGEHVAMTLFTILFGLVIAAVYVAPLLILFW